MHASAIVLAILALGPRAQTPAPSPAPARPALARPELLSFAARLEQRVAATSRSAQPVVFLSGLPETRCTYLPGVGAIYILPPRALPPEANERPASRAQVREWRTSPDGETVLLAPSPLASPSGSATGTTATAGSPQVSVGVKPADLAKLEAQIREARRESEKLRAQAEEAFAEAERQFFGQLQHEAGFEGATVRAPWMFLLADDATDARTPLETERDVREAIVTALVEDHAFVRGLQAGDTVTVSVDLVARRQPWVPAKPNRTLIVRAKKSDLDAAVSGAATREETIRKVETIVY
jgi:hypothetical protein